MLYRHHSQLSLPNMHWPKCRVTDIWESSSHTTSGGTITLISYWAKQRACCRSFADCGHHWTKSPFRTCTWPTSGRSWSTPARHGVTLGLHRWTAWWRFQRRAAKIILRRPLFLPSNHDELLAAIGWPSLASRRKYFQAVLGYRMATSNVPQHLRDYIPPKPTHVHNTRKPPFFQLPTTNTSLMLNSPLLSTKQQILSTLFLQFCSLPQVSHSLKTVPHYSYSHAYVHAVSTLVSK